jgi:hypothetical protein
MDHNAYNELKCMVKEAMYEELTKEAMSVAGAKKIATEAAHKAVQMLNTGLGKAKGFSGKAGEFVNNHGGRSVSNHFSGADVRLKMQEAPGRLSGAEIDKGVLHARIRRALLAGGGVGGAGYAGYEATN